MAAGGDLFGEVCVLPYLHRVGGAASVIGALRSETFTTGPKEGGS